MMQKKSKWISALLAMVLAVVMLGCVCAHADNSGIDLAAESSLTITFAPDDKPAVGVQFELYRVAELVGEEYVLSEQFSNCPIDLKMGTADEKRLTASTLQAYVLSDHIQADYVTDKTNANGVVSFSGLQTGLYLAMGDVFQMDGAFYFPTPLLVRLPDQDANGVWAYDIQVTTKHTLRPSDKEEIELDVMKVWDDGDAASRPESIKVELYGDKEYYDEVVLNKENNWRYTWSGLDAGTRWSVVEAEVLEGYTVTVEQIEDTFVITNTAKEEPDEPTSSEPTDSSEKPGTSETPGTSEKPGTPSTNPSKPGDKLPQTGMLWWPVFALTAGGLALILVGVIRRRSANVEE